MRIRFWGGALCAIAWVLFATGAEAQFSPAFEGSQIGAMLMQQQDMAEKACENGTPVPAPQRERIAAAIQELMDRYARLMTAPDPNGWPKVFAMKDPTVSWRTPDAQDSSVGPDAMIERFARPSQAVIAASGPVQAFPPPTVLEVTGDGVSAKGVWNGLAPSVGVDNHSGGEALGVDFVRVQDGFFVARWKILHLHFYVAPAAPDLPKHYCHWNPAMAY